MRFPVAPGATPRARHLRRAQTEAERRLWSRLRRRQLDGAYFRRQTPIGAYVCDFICASRRLALELDGGQHAMRTERDDVRTANLETLGFRVMRFWNPDVLRDTEAVIATIYAALIERRGLEGKTLSLPSP